MIKLKLWSDIHLEFSEHNSDRIWEKGSGDKETILVLAGDIDVGVLGVPFIEELSREYKHVIFVCGNHEFYNRDFFLTIRAWEKYYQSGPDNFHFLNNSSVTIDGTKFIGGIMWTNFNNEDFKVMDYAARAMSDYHLISKDGGFITPKFIVDEHKNFVNFLIDEVDRSNEGDLVVVTHHSPGNGKRLLNRERLSDYLYFADLESFLNTNDKIKLWMHGHSHKSWDYTINKTRIVCNPYGYYGQSLNKDFNKNFLIEL